MRGIRKNQSGRTEAEGPTGVLTENGRTSKGTVHSRGGSQSGKAVWELVGKHPQSGKRSSDFMQ